MGTHTGTWHVHGMYMYMDGVLWGFFYSVTVCYSTVCIHVCVIVSVQLMVLYCLEMAIVLSLSLFPSQLFPNMTSSGMLY